MYIGVDIGTSVTKAAGYDEHGAELCASSVPTELIRAHPGRVEQDVRAVLDSVAAVVRSVAAELPARPRLLALTGQGDGVWLHDDRGEAVRPAISWLDARAGDLVRNWDTDGTADLILRRNGGMIFPGASAPILAVLDREEPDVLDKASTATHCTALVFHQLTGERTIDVSDASFPFLDPRTRTYDAEILAACGLAHRGDLLPPIARDGGPDAPLTAESADRLGIPAGTRVSAGPYDLPACARGSGIVEPGDGLLIAGTTLACQVVTDNPAPLSQRAGLLLSTWQQGRWLRAMPAMVGTASLSWLLDMIGASLTDLPRLLSGSAPGARGVTVLPYWSASGERAPFMEPSARGQFDGLHLGSTKADLVRGLCEGLAFAARHCFEAANLTGRLAVCGGGTHSGALMQLFADVLGRAVEIVDVGQTGAYGSVLAALESDGDSRDWPISRHTVEPTGTDRTYYDDAYRDYQYRVAMARERWREAAGQGKR